MTQQFTPRNIYPREGKHMSTQNLNMNIQSRIIHDSQKLKTTQMSTHGWMNKVYFTDTIVYIQP